MGISSYITRRPPPLPGPLIGDILNAPPFDYTRGGRVPLRQPRDRQPLGAPPAGAGAPSEGGAEVRRGGGGRPPPSSRAGGAWVGPAVPPPPAPRAPHPAADPAGPPWR